MLLPRELYYTLPSSEEAYSESPSGRLDVERLIEGKADCFEQITGGELLIPKTIVLNNIYSEGIVAKDEKNFLNLLHKKGFKIFINDAGKLIPFTPDSEYQRRAYTFTSNDEIAEQISIPQEQLYILDYQNLFKLLHPGEPIRDLDLAVRGIYFLNEILEDSKKFSHFLHYLKHSNFDICISCLHPKYLFFIQSIQDKIAPKRILYKFTEIKFFYTSSLTSKSFNLFHESLIKLNWSNIREINFIFPDDFQRFNTTYRELGFNLSDLPNLMALESATLKLSDKIPGDVQQIDLNPNLQSLILEFENYDFRIKTYTLCIPENSRLKSLELSICNSNKLILRLGSTGLPELENLSINDCLEWHFPQPEFLPKLKVLHLDSLQNFRITGQYLSVKVVALNRMSSSILQAFPNIEELEIKSHAKNEVLNWENFHPFNQLKKLTIKRGTYQLPLPSQAPIIEEIYLWPYEQIKKKIFEEIKDYHQLQSVKFVNFDFLDTVSDFINTLGKIKILLLSSCKLNVPEEIIGHTFENLESITFLGLIASQEFWNSFFKNDFPQLKELSITLTKESLIEGFNLTELLRDISNLPISVKIGIDLSDLHLTDPKIIEMITEFNSSRAPFSNIRYIQQVRTPIQEIATPPDPYLEQFRLENEAYFRRKEMEGLKEIFKLLDLPAPASSQTHCDLPTSGKKQTLKTRIIFHGKKQLPVPNIYRLQAYNQIQYQATNPNPIILTKTTPTLTHAEIQINPEAELFSTMHENQFWAKIDLQVTSTEWQPLPSLKIGERITHFKCWGANHRIFSDFEICYSPSDHFYYIKLKDGQTPRNLTLEWLVSPSEEQLTPPEELTSIASVYRSIPSDVDKSLEGSFSTLDEYTTAIKEQQTGACRHRAVAFLHEMQKLGYTAQIITNDCHAYVEVKDKLSENWYTIDLGGYAADLQIQSQYSPPTETPESVADAADESPTAGTAVTDGEASDESSEDKKEELESKRKTLAQQIKDQFEALRPERLEHFAKHFQISREGPKPSFLATVQELLQPPSDENKTFLLNLTEKHIFDVALQIYQQAHQTGRRVFYAIHREDLASKNFEEFLTQGTEPPPILIIDYSQFSINDILRFSHSLYDIQETSGGVKLPENLKIIGLIDKNSPSAYLGADFTSRFKRQLDLEDLPPVRDWAFPSESIEAPIKNVINLYSSSAWKKRLLSHPVIHGGEIVQAPGLLDLARNSYPIQLLSSEETINPDVPSLMKNSEGHYVFYYRGNTFTPDEAQQAKLKALDLEPPRSFDFIDAYPITQILKQTILVAIEIQNPPRLPQFTKWMAENKILSDISEVIHVIPQKDIDFSPYATLINPDESEPTQLEILNPSRFNDFFEIYDVEGGLIQLKPGILTQYLGRNLDILLTHSLSPSQWQEFFDYCQKNNIQLRLFYPSESEFILEPSIKDWLKEWNPSPEDGLIICEHPEFLIECDRTEGQLVIDVSEMKSYELFERMVPDPDNPPLGFKKIKSALFQALEQDDINRIILTGDFSEELQQRFISDWKNLSTEQKQKITIITSKNIPGMSGRKTSTPLEEMKTYLKTTYSKERVERVLAAHPDASYTQWITYLKHPDTDPFQALSRIALPSEADEDPLAFQEKRKAMIEKSLSQSPYVYIAGLTGVGKSQFVLSDLGYPVMNENIHEWASAPAPADGQPLILFLDEANLKPTDWTCFRGLYESPPRIVVDGTLYTLSPSHKVIFAGNPASYSHDRTIAKLFKEHGEVIVFNPIPIEALLAQEVLDEDIQQQLRTCYRFLMHLSKDEVLITPRHIKRIIRLIQNHDDQNAVSSYYIRLVIREYVPSAHLKNFDDFFPACELPPQDLALDSKDLVVTESRKPQLEYLQNILKLREKEVSDAGNRIVLEGPPGEGKTEFLIHTLVSQGFKEKRMVDESEATEPATFEETPTKTFYRLHVSMPAKQIKAMLLRAFDEGAIVICDEINALNAYEKLLNSILDGKHPETAEAPRQKGFRLIGTQNPSIMGGRGIDSSALASRSILIKFPAYPVEDMQEIAEHKGLKNIYAKDLAQAYFQQRNQAIAQKQKPIPCFRDFIKALNAEISVQEATSSQELFDIASQFGLHEIDAVKIASRFAEQEDIEPFIAQVIKTKEQILTTLNFCFKNLTKPQEWLDFYLKNQASLPQIQDLEKHKINATQWAELIQFALEKNIKPHVIKAILKEHASLETVKPILETMERFLKQMSPLSAEQQQFLYEWLQNDPNPSIIQFYVKNYEKTQKHLPKLDIFIHSAIEKGLPIEEALALLGTQETIPNEGKRNELIKTAIIEKAKTHYQSSLATKPQITTEQVSQFINDLTEHYQGPHPHFYDYLTNHLDEFQNACVLFVNGTIESALEKGTTHMSGWVWTHFSDKQEQLLASKEKILTFIKNNQLHSAYEELKNYITIAKSYRYQDKPTRSYSSFFNSLDEKQKENIAKLHSSAGKKFKPE